MRHPHEKNPHKLTLALEPECAALYCQQLSNDLLALYSDMPDSLSPDSYMVCDLGAGTLDITAYIKHGEDDIEVTIPPTGNDSGGKEINQQFCRLLEQIVGDPGFQSLGQSFFWKRRKNDQVIMNTLIHYLFERQKLHFGDEAMYESGQPDQETLRVSLDLRLFNSYSNKKVSKGVRNLNDDRIVFNEGMLTLEIGYAKVRELFEPVVQRAIQCIKSALMREEIKERIKMIYLVGGFGGCHYTYSALRKAIPSDIHVVVPRLHKVAVSRGAVLYRRNPAIIKARRMDASYGISCNSLFDARVHDEAYAFRDPNTGEKKCRNVFSVFVKKGQKVEITDRFEKIMTPCRQTTVQATFTFYTTTDLSIKYTVDKRGRSILSKIGSLTLDCPNPDKLDKKDREMKVTMDFSSTEMKVQARALYLPGQPPVKAVLDFL